MLCYILTMKLIIISSNNGLVLKVSEENMMLNMIDTTLSMLSRTLQSMMTDLNLKSSVIYGHL